MKIGISLSASVPGVKEELLLNWTRSSASQM
jgi:hypothetical protein